MFNPEVGDEIWVIGYCGPKSAIFHSIWPAKRKVVVEFHGTPEVVSLDDCFTTRAACLREAAVRETKKAVQFLMQAEQYNEAVKAIEEPAESGVNDGR